MGEVPGGNSIALKFSQKTHFFDLKNRPQKSQNFQLFQKSWNFPTEFPPFLGLKMTNFGGNFHEKGGKLSQNINNFINFPYYFIIFV